MKQIFAVAAAAAVLTACGMGTDDDATVAGEAQQALIDSALAGICPADPAPNLLTNGGFEEGLAGWRVDVWQPGAQLTADTTRSYSGNASARIRATTSNDAALVQGTPVDPWKLYRLSGWLRAKDVAPSDSPWQGGANLCSFGTWAHTPALIGTSPWQFVPMAINSEERTSMEIGARLGFWGGDTTGTAWFDDVAFERILPQTPHPEWSFLVLVYADTDFTFTGTDGIERRVVAHMTAGEKRAAADRARRFVEQDLTPLSGGNVRGKVTVRFPQRALTTLSTYGTGYWPDLVDTAPERAPEFDAVIVIWDPRGTDVLHEGQPVWLGSAGGLTPYTSVYQTYNAIVIDMIVVWGDSTNVFKHEFGHSLLWYFEALGVTPSPTVTNHAEVTDYVHCGTGAPYLWVDETGSNPIPNSIYNNDSGFTHDYYSGTVALAAAPQTCLGVNADAWAYGGPASALHLPWKVDPGERLDRLALEIDRLVDARALGYAAGESLIAKLEAADDALDEDRTAAALRRLGAFTAQVQSLVTQGRLSQDNGDGLTGTALDIVEQLCRRSG